MKNGIFFLTYDGYYNFTSGIGTQTKTFLKGIDAYYERYRKLYGDFEINLVVPDFDPTVYGYNKQDIEYADRIIKKFGGKVYTCQSSFDREGSNFWTSENWEKISISASSLILQESAKYKKCLIVTVDPPFMHVPMSIAKVNPEIQSVILMYTSAYIHDENPLENRIRWEKQGFLSASEYKNIKIGDVCDYMSDHFVKFYDVYQKSFVPYPSSLFLRDADFDRQSQDKILQILKKYDIPLDRDIVFAFGRMAWVKGFDTLLNGFGLIKNKAHLVFVATQFEDRIEEYKEIIRKNKLDCTLITTFTRDLPSALCQYGRCKIVVCPSRREPFSNIPLEVGIWAKEKGPVVLASDIGGFVQEIIDGENGFLFKVDDSEDLARKIDSILLISEERLKSIRIEAYNKVQKERDFFKNFGLLLTSLWGVM